MVSAVPPFVLAILAIVLLGSVALMITIFCRAFSNQSPPRLPLSRSDAGEALPAPYSHVNAGRGRGQSDVMQGLELGAHDLFNPQTAAEVNERRLARGLRPPEASIARGTVVVFFQVAYTVCLAFSTS
ncbi:hypothetical protein DFS33DRAFT_994986 [Desarmillaria ectypa]|nr:hypothetical protein DFS33DRAFT_994986 [Desarmillaria ectypa]